MKSLLTARDVLNEIEFELVQGAISRDDLGRGIQAVRQHQNKVRSEVLRASRRAPSSRKVVTQLFQINEMLITLVQETAAAVQSLRMDLRKVARMQIASSATAPPSISTTGEKSIDIPMATEAPTPDRVEVDLDWQVPAELENAMRPQALQVKMDVRSADVPIIGGLVRRLRVALHSLACFYVYKLAGKQVEVNLAYGDWIVRLIQMYEHQQRQIDVLSTRLTSLEARLAEADETLSPPPPSAAS